MKRLNVALAILVGTIVSLALIVFFWPKFPPVFSVGVWLPAGESDSSLVESYVSGQARTVYDLEEFKRKTFSRVYWLVRPHGERRADCQLLMFGREVTGQVWSVVVDAKRSILSESGAVGAFDLKSCRLVGNMFLAEATADWAVIMILAGGEIFVASVIGFFFWLFLEAKPKVRLPISFD